MLCLVNIDNQNNFLQQGTFREIVGYISRITNIYINNFVVKNL